MLGSKAPRPAALPALIGGALCLDFANTVDDRSEPEPHDYLPSYPALLAWSLHAGALSQAEASRIEALARIEPAPAERALVTALGAREALYSLFDAVADGGQPGLQLLAPVNRVLRRLGGAARLVPAGDAARLEWEAGTEVTLDTPALRVLGSAVELLTGPDLARVRQCVAADCSWLFLDPTRNHSRRWCRADRCGARDRFRRYYARHRKER
ncbi:ABATE domain-containing protein [Candidatus Nephthysia bennettiae]|uniref:ABATE domain-containing protein n=1 Tax=Candidatus Nephthysia bennettiae TaxID=3127016 RepID=A0A934K9D1_9BACT|nr:ABATE domain-containing protein [Candidatus Dormibacteraeota bacterium]MBJ7612172.1 ABATE domain-containing protein [Candidatus Dormibacteraeota bacterium]